MKGLRKNRISLRPAQADDAAGIAQVHIAAWQSTYRGILPDTLLEQLSLAERTDNWQQWIQQEALSWVWVAESPARQIIGFVCGGPERTAHPNWQGEIYAIYLLEGWQGRGVGKRLLQKGFELLSQQGHSSALIWVASANHKACGFYAAQGGQVCLQRSQTIGGHCLDETGYGWTCVFSASQDMLK